MIPNAAVCLTKKFNLSIIKAYLRNYVHKSYKNTREVLLYGKHQKRKKKLSKEKRSLIIILAIIAAIVIGELISINWHSNPENIVKYETDNPHIVDSDLPLVSAHRSGGGIAPEETMMAFKNCAENPGFDVDIFEFDLHITKDDVLVLLHDDTLDRTSNSQEVFGRKDVRPEEFTYDELRSLNMGAKFEDEDGNMPYDRIGKRCRSGRASHFKA